MKSITQFLIPGMIIPLAISCGPGEHGEATQPAYEPTWESLARHESAPEWFRDAKFGIYFHWGVYSVPAFGTEWYPSNMHYAHRREYQHHLENYGHPSEFGYHDFVPMFRAEHFDAGEWAALFKKAGARFAGPVAEHHDGFAMWDSEATPWNAMDKGPKRDLTGELAAAIRGEGMKFITTFHHAKHLQRFDSLPDPERGRIYRNSHYPFFRDMPPSSDDPELKYLYGNIPEEQWLEEVWFAKLKEVVDQYQPDIMWFDSWLDRIPESYRLKYASYYLNEALKWDKEVVIVRKQDDLPLDFTVLDLEKSRMNRIDSLPWMTDETVSTGSWCYTRDLKIKASRDVLHVLIDIVSKNGVLLLNVSPRADGIIPEDQQQVLRDIGVWLDQYGEAIYGTRPWYTYGEGPTKEPEGHFANRAEFLKLRYSTRDIRYTTRDQQIYACIMGQPEAGQEILLRAFSQADHPGMVRVKQVGLLGSGEKPDWEHSEDGLLLTMPDAVMDESAVVLKIETK